MQLIKQSNGRWEVLSSFQERHLIPRQENGRSFFVWNYWDSPNRWSTDRARVAAMLAAYADDETRADIEKRAREEADPDVATLLFDGATYRYYSPYEQKDAARDAGFEFTREPSPAHWHTQDPDRAVKCYQIAMTYPGFTCPSAIQMVLQAHLEAQQARLDGSHLSGLDIDLPCPEGLDYRLYQKSAIVYGSQRRHVIFGDPPGVGKTMECLGLINALGLKTGLIVPPATLKRNWFLEANKWLVGGQTIGVATRKGVPDTDIVIVNFESLGFRQKSDACLGCGCSKALHDATGIFPCRGVPEVPMGLGSKIRCMCIQFAPTPPADPVLRKELASREWDFVAVDEFHRMVNPKTFRYQLTFSVRAKRFVMISGSPMLNGRPKELFPILNRLAPEVFGNEWEYMRSYCAGTDKGASRLDEWQYKVRTTLMVRRLKSEVMPELPPKQRQVLELPAGALMRFANAEQDRLAGWKYLKLELQTRVALSLASEDPEDHKRAVAALKEGRKVAFSEMAKLRHDTAVAKIPLVIRHIETSLESTSKVVVFAHHRDVINALGEYFGKRAVVVFGDTPEEARTVRKDRFNDDPTCQVFVGGIFVAGVGLSLKASLLMMAELDWVPDNVFQCEDRCHGVNRGVEGEQLLVQHLVLEGSLDANMARTMVYKQGVAEKALDKQEGYDVVTPLDPAFEYEPEAVVLGEKREAVAPEEVDDLPSTHGATPEWIVKTAEKLSAADVALIFAATRKLAGLCDGAASRDSVGFNKFDIRLGHSLAASESLSQKSAALALRLCKKYNSSQLGGMLDSLYEREGS